MKKTTTHIGRRAFLVAGALCLVAGLAHLSAQEPGITFATGGIDIKIDSQASYNGASVPSGTWSLKDLVPGADKFFNFGDIKPGDKGENTISIHTKNDPAWACLEFTNLKESEHGENEPEGLADTSAPAQGELAQNMEFFAWRDDGDNVFEAGEKPLFGTTTQAAVQTLNNKTYPIADYKNGPAIPKNTTKHVGIYWCAGDLTVNTATAAISCNGAAMGNAAQTDSMNVDVTLRAVSANDEPRFACAGYVAPPPPGPSCDLGHDDRDNNTNHGNNSNNNNSSSHSNSSGNGGKGNGPDQHNNVSQGHSDNKFAAAFNHVFGNFFKKR